VQVDAVAPDCRVPPGAHGAGRPTRRHERDRPIGSTWERNRKYASSRRRVATGCRVSEVGFPTLSRYQEDHPGKGFARATLRIRYRRLESITSRGQALGDRDRELVLLTRLQGANLHRAHAIRPNRLPFVTVVPHQRRG